MTIEQYRNSELSEQLAKLLNSDASLQLALQVCDEASPSRGGIKDWKEPHIAHIQLGIDRGYNLYPQLLRALATAMPKPVEVEPTYEGTEEEK